MPYTVFFKERNQIFTAEKFINDQPILHRQLLSTIAEELSSTGATSNPQASKNSKGEWTIVISDNGAVYVYTMYVSKFEMPDRQIQQKSEPVKNKILVIIDPSGARDSVGGYHPGYWSVDEYADFLQENQRALFTQTIFQIKNSTPSEHYSIEDDGTISIHINKKDKSTIVTLNCHARWILTPAER